MTNKTQITEFIIIGFTSSKELQFFLFPFFFLAYLLTFTQHVKIIMVIHMDYHLHTPMYFFLVRLSFLDISYVTVTVPRMLGSFITGNKTISKLKTISFVGCFTQSYIYFLLGTTDYILFSVMSFDRYVAICNPLNYSTIMTWKRCIQLAIGCWVGGFLSISIPTYLKAQLPFCGPNEINHFFCDSVAVMKLACMDTSFIQLIDFFLFSLVLLGSIIFVVFTYTCIILAIVRIPSASRQKKAFSTCSSHFIIMSVSYGSSIFIYVTPTQGTFLDTNKTMSAVSTFLMPILNPFIFTLRNQNFSAAHLVNIFGSSIHLKSL
uniref:G-protein coupled receptors family 1 profile domain-containing protein n=1 Tax=Leptobrachium leishanense TaxID=445787 RepID=A0A8C5QA98_9ANUR